MSKCMLVDFKKVNDISKPSDSKHYKGFKIFSGGAGGNRTPVRKPSAGRSTYLAYYLNLTNTPLTSNRIY